MSGFAVCALAAAGAAAIRQSTATSAERIRPARVMSASPDRGERLVYWCVATDEFEGGSDQAVVLEHGEQDGGDVVARDLAALDRVADLHAPGGRVVRQHPRPHDRVVEPAGGERLVRVVLRVEIGAED